MLTHDLQNHQFIDNGWGQFWEWISIMIMLGVAPRIRGLLSRGDMLSKC